MLRFPGIHECENLMSIETGTRTHLHGKKWWSAYILRTFISTTHQAYTVLRQGCWNCLCSSLSVLVP